MATWLDRSGNRLLVLLLWGSCLGGGGDRAWAFDPEHLRQLFATNQCEGCDLSGADLSGQRMSYANLSGADLRGANLSGANLESVLAWNANFAGANLTGANLEDATLSRANLQGVNLRSATLEDCDLDGTDLTGVDLSGVDLSRVNFNGSNLTGAQLMGADLSWAELNRANLTNADLTGAILFGADLNQANLTGAKLDGANIDGAEMAGVIGYSGPLPKAGPAILIQEQQDSAEGNRLLEQGVSLFSQGQLPEAQATWEQALGIYRRDRDGAGAAAAMAQLALVNFQRGQLDQAIDWGFQALNLARQERSASAESVALGIIGNVHYERADYLKALEFYQQRLQASAGGPFYHAALIDRAKGAIAIGDYATGMIDSLEVLNDPLQTATPVRRLGALITMVQGLIGAGDYAQARRYLSEARQDLKGVSNRLWEPEFWQLSSALDLNQGNFAAAIAAAEQAWAIAPSPRLKYAAQRSIGLAQAAQGNWGAAIKSYEAALKIAQTVNDRRGQVEVLSDLGLALHQSGDLNRAASVLTQASEGWDELVKTFIGEDYFKVGFIELQTQVNQRLQDVYLAQNRPEQALVVSEQGRSRVFLDLMMGKLAAQGRLSNPDAAVSVESIQATARSQRATLVIYAVQQEDSTTYCSIYSKSCQLTTAKPQTSALNPPPPNQVNIWVVSPEGQIHFRRGQLPQAENQPHPVPLNDLVGRSRSKVTFQQLPSLRQLHSLLIEPIADLLPKQPSDRVVFIPQGTLFLVPFAALRDADGQYLIQNHTLSVSPSIRVLALASSQLPPLSAGQPQPLRGPALVVGNPTMPQIPDHNLGDQERSLAPLPGASLEARAIAQLLNTQPLEGAAATETAVTARMEESQIIHLATHGLLDDYFGEGVIPAVPGALALAPSPNPEGDDQDGFLTTEEILNLKLKAQLVVLSACDTGRGRLTSDGAIGLSRAFIVAGAPSTVVSLWAVPDQPTSELMLTFYREFLKSGDRAAALRAAMLDTQQRHPDPVNWAAFSLVGAAR